MILTNDFCYNRQFYIRDLAKPKVIFGRCQQLEFDTFESFINNYLTKQAMLETPITKVIVPVEKEGQLSSIKEIKGNAATFLFYLKSFAPEIISEIKDLATTNFGIFVDYNNALTFKEVFESLPEEARKEVAVKLASTHGAFRLTLNKGNLNDFLDNLLKPFLIFPFFNFCDLNIEYHTFEEVQLKDLHQLVYYFKLIYKIIQGAKYIKEVNWTKYNDAIQSQTFSLEFMKRDGSELYIANDKVRFSLGETNLPEYECALFSQDGNNLSQALIDRFLGAISVGYDQIYFVSKEENKLCNGNLTTLPYLNRIACNILRSGDI